MFYTPQPAPNDPDNVMVSYTYRELSKLSLLLRQSTVFTKVYAAPLRPTDGQVEFADGTDWNPGGGQGLYIYYANAWNKLG